MRELKQETYIMKEIYPKLIHFMSHVGIKNNIDINITKHKIDLTRLVLFMK